MSRSGIAFMKHAVFPGSPMVHLAGRKIEAVESRICEIAAENGMTITDVMREALKCFVICYDKPLGPKAEPPP